MPKKVHSKRLPLNEVLKQAKTSLWQKKNQNNDCLRGARNLLGKRHEASFWGDGNALYVISGLITRIYKIVKTHCTE